MSEKKIIVEGAGGNDKNTSYLKVCCRKGFKTLLEKVNPDFKAFAIVPKGGRRAAYESFKNEHEKGGLCFLGLLVDSEDPVNNTEKPWEHVKNRVTDNWDRPTAAADEQIFLMATCMETLFVADPDALEAHYGGPTKFHRNALPSHVQLEARDHHRVIEALKHATRDCKHQYDKDADGFKLLEVIDPHKLNAVLPSFRRTTQLLQEHLRACPPTHAKRR